MWSFIKTAIILFIVSLIVLYLVDHVIEYMKNTYTTKKTKDIMGTQIQKYKMMVDDMYQQERLRWTSTEHSPTNPTLSSQEIASVNDDLEDFIKSIA
jgi:predicted PurR-regulated permease PerM